MDGRFLRLPAQYSKKRQILLLYGHHASLERMYGLAEVLNRYGTVTMPDLPGFGGMDSFYKIGQKPSLESYADYLASLIKLNYKRRRITIVAMSFSVPLVIHTLQNILSWRVKLIFLPVIAGFAHHDDFIFSKKMNFFLRFLARLYTYRMPALFAKKVILNKTVIKSAYL